jgi:hypothetical protein
MLINSLEYRSVLDSGHYTLLLLSNTKGGSTQKIGIQI